MIFPWPSGRTLVLIPGGLGGWLVLSGCGEGWLGDNQGRIDPSSLPAGPSPCRDPIEVQVIQGKDGDTFEVEDAFGAEFIVRMIGVDSPEKGSEVAATECWGLEAAEYTTDLLLGEKVWVTFDAECTDLYGRSLGYVHSGPAGKAFFNEQLLRDGFAGVMPIPPNNSFSERFFEVQVASRETAAGMWGACL